MQDKEGSLSQSQVPSHVQYHVSTELTNQKKIGHRKGVIENKWYCDIPDITIPTIPNLQWIDEDLGVFDKLVLHPIPTDTRGSLGKGATSQTTNPAPTLNTKGGAHRVQGDILHPSGVQCFPVFRQRK